MRPRDWFSVGIRLLGAWLYYQALLYVLYAVSWFLGINAGVNALEKGDVGRATGYYLLMATGLFALGTHFLFGAEHLTRLSFNEPTPDDTDEPTTPSR